MRIAQQLYEGVDIKGQGTVRVIHIPAYRFCPCSGIWQERPWQRILFQKAMETNIFPPVREQRKQPENIQDAHEAIRPTDINRVPSEIRVGSEESVQALSAYLEAFYCKPYGKI